MQDLCQVRDGNRKVVISAARESVSLRLPEAQCPADGPATSRGGRSPARRPPQAPQRDSKVDPQVEFDGQSQASRLVSPAAPMWPLPNSAAVVPVWTPNPVQATSARTATQPQALRFDPHSPMWTMTPVSFFPVLLVTNPVQASPVQSVPLLAPDEPLRAQDQPQCCAEGVRTPPHSPLGKRRPLSTPSTAASSRPGIFSL